MKIVTDSAADLTPEDITSLGIDVAPLYIQFPDGEVRSEDITHDEFYRRLENMQPKIPTTAQASADGFVKIYEKLLAASEEVLSVHISSGLSGTVDAARSGAAKLGSKAIHIVDSLTLSGEQRFQVLAAARAIQAGWPVDAIRIQLDKIRAASEVIYTLDTLSYLARGGRIGRVQALASSLLDIKPIITVEKSDGKYNTVGKSRTLGRALDEMGRYLEKRYSSQLPMWISVMHGKFGEKASQMAEILQRNLNVAKLEILRISPVLGVHTGPGIVGAAVMPMELMEEIR